MTHDNKFKWDGKFVSKSWSSVYDIEKFPNDGDEDLFGIDSSIDMIQAYASHHWSSFSRIPKELWYSLSQ